MIQPDAAQHSLLPMCNIYLALSLSLVPGLEFLHREGQAGPLALPQVELRPMNEIAVSRYQVELRKVGLRTMLWTACCTTHISYAKWPDFEMEL